MRFTDQTAVVTGGTRGIGLAIARSLADQGAEVTITGRRREVLEEAAGDTLHPLVMDVTDEASVCDGIAQAVEARGPIQICVPNAGVAEGRALHKTDTEFWRWVMATNLDGVFLCFREWGRHMSQREGGGKLVGISSISAIFGTPLQPHYAASKGGLEALARSFATRMSRYDVQVNAIEPGWIETDATEGAWQDESFSKSIVRRIPARRWGTPADLAGVCIYLASPASNYHTGDTLRVDGGYSVF